MLVKFINRVKSDISKQKETEEKPADVPAPKSDEVLLLEEIRDALKSKQ